MNIDDAQHERWRTRNRGEVLNLLHSTDKNGFHCISFLREGKFDDVNCLFLRVVLSSFPGQGARPLLENLLLLLGRERRLFAAPSPWLSGERRSERLIRRQSFVGWKLFSPHCLSPVAHMCDNLR